MNDPIPARERARLAADCLEVATRASAVALRGFRTRPAAAEKALKDLVTEFDVAAEELALRVLAERHPGVAVMAEETTPDPEAVPPGLVFTVDPIDGTTNFAHGHPVWCTAIGVLWDGEPIAGAVVAPCLATTWHGHHHPSGGEALRNGAPCRVSDTKELASALVATGFPPDRTHAPANNFDSFVSVKRAAQAVRRCGAAAIDVCFVADGTYDAYWERRLRIWDVAAGGALVRAAGGVVTALDGGPPAWARGHLVASNGRVHEALVAAVAGR